MAAPDPYALFAALPDGPSNDFVAVTPSDTVDLPFRPRRLYIGVSGDVSVLAADESTVVVFKAAPVGLLPIRTSRVRVTGTTATNIVALK